MYFVVNVLINPRTRSEKLRFRSTSGPMRSGESSMLGVDDEQFLVCWSVKDVDMRSKAGSFSPDRELLQDDICRATFEDSGSRGGRVRSKLVDKTARFLGDADGQVRVFQAWKTFGLFLRSQLMATRAHEVDIEGSRRLSSAGTRGDDKGTQEMGTHEMRKARSSTSIYEYVCTYKDQTHTRSPSYTKRHPTFPLYSEYLAPPLRSPAICSSMLPPCRKTRNIEIGATRARE